MDFALGRGKRRSIAMTGGHNDDITDALMHLADSDEEDGRSPQKLPMEMRSMLRAESMIIKPGTDLNTYGGGASPTNRQRKRPAALKRNQSGKDVKHGRGRSGSSGSSPGTPRGSRRRKHRPSLFGGHLKDGIKHVAHEAREAASEMIHGKKSSIAGSFTLDDDDDVDFDGFGFLDSEEKPGWKVREHLVEFLRETRLDLWMDIAQVFLSVVACVFYVWQTYELDWKANRPGMYKVDTAITFAFIFARRDSAEDFSRLNALLFTAMAWILIPAHCFAVP